DQFAVHLLLSGGKHVVQAAAYAEVAPEVDLGAAGELTHKAQRREWTVEELRVGQAVRQAKFEEWSKTIKVVLDVIVPSIVGTTGAYTFRRAAGRRSQRQP